MAVSALVTGATSGIGKATALALAKAGYDLHLIGRREERLQEVAEEVGRLGRVARVCVLDIRDRGAVDDFFQSEGSALSELEVLVNNAGLAKGVEKMQEARQADWDEMLDTNVKGLLAFTRGVLPHLVKKKKGHIVNLGSVAGRWIYPGGAVYCASKFAVRAITEGLRMDLAGTGIRVTNIEPGMVETEFSLVRLGDEKAAAKVYEGMKPLSAEDIADCVLWALQRPAHVNIQELVVFPTDQAAVGQVHRQV